MRLSVRWGYIGSEACGDIGKTALCGVIITDVGEAGTEIGLDVYV